MDRRVLTVAYPRLYHLTARRYWKSILEHGLLSAIDLAAECGFDRDEIIGRRRATCRHVNAPKSSLKAVIRDQVPMNVDKLLRYIDHQGNRITLERWLERQSERVFFFVSEAAAGRMAAKYEALGHPQDMFVVNADSLVNEHLEDIGLSAYNSGFNRTDRRNPADHPSWYKLHHEMFMPIADYPYKIWQSRRRKSKGEPVVELTVRGCVPDMRKHTEKVVEMNKGKADKTVYQRKFKITRSR